MDIFDWHGAPISRATIVDATYRNTQNVRRFMREQCGGDFSFDRDLMAWIRGGEPRCMGDVVDEYLRRRRGAMPRQGDGANTGPPR